MAVVGLYAVNAALVPMLSDQVPAGQRGRISGVLGMGTPVGAVGGSLLVQALSGGSMLVNFLAPAVLLVVGVGILLPSFTDRRLSPAEARLLPRLGLREFASSFWVSPRRYPDFAWAWLSRFLVFLAVALLVTFQVFFLTNQLGVALTEVTAYVALSTVVHYACVLAASPLGGWLTDRLRRRKVFVAGAAVVYAGGMLVIATSSTFPVFLIGMAITGIGEGIYLAVDLALITDILPHRDQAAKELGVFTVANTMPPAVAPAIAPIFLAIPFFARGDEGNYVALFGVAAIFALLGAVAIAPVQATR